MKNYNLKILLKNPLTYLLVMMVFFSCASAVNYGGQIPGIDFYQFWVVGKAINQLDVNNIYSNADRKKIGASSKRLDRQWRRASSGH